MNKKYQSFNDFLNEIYGHIQICGIDFWASDILEEIDPIAYRTEFLDYQDTYGK